VVHGSVEQTKYGQLHSRCNAFSRHYRPPDEVTSRVANKRCVLTGFVDRADDITVFDEVSGIKLSRPEAPPSWSHDQALANVQEFA